jgi:macrolide transport system ATP-binding/permease protein
VLRDRLVVAAVGITIGAGASLALGRYVRALLFEVSAADAVSLAVAAALMLAVAVLAGVLPARRAATVDPAVALRGD